MAAPAPARAPDSPRAVKIAPIARPDAVQAPCAAAGPVFSAASGPSIVAINRSRPPQRGHANPTTTLRHYARWIPTAGQRWVDTLDVGESGSRMVAKSLGTGRADLEVLGLAGAGGGT